MSENARESGPDGRALPALEPIAVSATASALDGLKIGVRQAGPTGATAIFCMHGIGSNASGYAGQLAGLSDRYRVIAWDAPGYGASDSLPSEKPTAEDYARVVRGLAASLGIERMVAVGSSFGAVIAAYVAMLFPELTAAAVLSAPAPGNARLPPAERQAMLNGRVVDMRTLGPAGVADKRSSLLVAPGSPPAIVETARRLVAATRPEGYIQAAHCLDTADTVEAAGRIRAPALVLVGSEDKVTPAETCARPIHAALRNGEIEVVSGIGHLIKLEAPDRFNDLVRSFLDRHGIA